MREDRDNSEKSRIPLTAFVLLVCNAGRTKSILSLKLAEQHTSQSWLKLCYLPEELFLKIHSLNLGLSSLKWGTKLFNNHKAVRTEIVLRCLEFERLE